MVKYKCDNCEKEFKQKNDLDRHKNRKFKCKNNNLDVITTINNTSTIMPQFPQNVHNISTKIINCGVNNNQSDSDVFFICDICCKKYSREDSLKRHQLSFCKGIKEDNTSDNKIDSKELLKTLTSMNETLQKSQQEIADLKNTISELKHTVSQPITNNTTTNNINNNNNNTINNNIILQFGADVEPNALTQEEIIQLLNQNLAYIVPKMAELYHFDINKPKYHNVYISDKKSKFAVVFNGKQYVSAFLDDTIDMIDNKMKSHLRLFMRKLKMNDDDTHKIPVNDMKRMSKQLEKLNDLEDTDDLQKRSNQYLKFVLFDNKEMVKDTRNKMDRTTKQKKNKVNRSEQVAVDY